MELDVDPEAAAVLAAHPDLRRMPLRPNLAAFVDAPLIDARLNELNLFATAIGQISVARRRRRLARGRLGADLRHSRRRRQP